MPQHTQTSHEVVEAVARESYGRLLAILAVRSRDLHAAEDALAEAFALALRHWPVTGVPERPLAWLLTASRRRLIDAGRRLAAERRHAQAVATLIEEQQAENIDMFQDERIKLLFTAAHPEIEPSARAPLMLQLIFQFDAARIAAVFLTSPGAMSARLVRAKARIRELAIPFEVPEAESLADRLKPVLDAIYAVYGTAWEAVSGVEDRRSDLRGEAIRLARIVVDLLPSSAEPKGLLALMLYCESRQSARRDDQGRYVPLGRQDTRLWNVDLITEAERWLLDAAEHREPGRFQLEAAIQSAHARRGFDGRVDWSAILSLYEGLLALEPTIAGGVAHAAAAAQVFGPSQGLALLERLPVGQIKSYQPFWATRADLLARQGRASEARVAYETAIGLCADPVVRLFLGEERNKL